MRRYRLLREAGGLGDVTRCLGVARAIKEADPDCELWFHVLSGYTDYCRRCPDVDRVVPILMKDRRQRDSLPDPARHDYLARYPGPWDATVDLFCPAFVYERETRGDVHLDRIDCWTGAAAHTTGLDLKPRLMRMNLTAADRAHAEGFFWAHGVDARRPLVAIQPLAVHGLRSMFGWQLEIIFGELCIAGYHPVVFHTRAKEQKPWEDHVLPVARRHKVPVLAVPDLPALAACIEKCRGAIGCDSGLFHVTAALGVPTVGLFGYSSGAIIARHYPTHAALDVADRTGLPCKRQCYGFTAAGWRPGICRTQCHAIARIDPALAVDVLARMLEGRTP